MKQKKILVTGASGLVGHLVYKHLDGFNNYEVYGADIQKGLSARYEMEKKLDKDPPKFKINRYIEMDITDEDAVGKIFAANKFDVVIHLAAVLENATEEQIQKVNIDGAKNIIDACVKWKVSRVIVASSIMTVLGYLEEEPYRFFKNDELEKLPKDIELISPDDQEKPYKGNEGGERYTQSKIDVENYAKEVAEKHPISMLVARLFWINVEDENYGRYMDRMRCTHEDVCTFFEKAVQASDEIKHDTFFVGSIFDHVTIFDFSNCEKIDFHPTENYSLTSHC